MCNSKDNLCNVSFCVSYFIKIISTPLFIGSPTYFCGRRSLHTSFCAPYFMFSPEFERLYDELTGMVVIWLDENGL